MKKTLTLLATLCLVTGAQACRNATASQAALTNPATTAAASASDDTIHRPDVDISDLHALNVESGATIIYRTGPKPRIVVHASEEEYQQTDISCEGGVLTIREKPGNSRQYIPGCTYYIMTPALSHIDVKGHLKFVASERVALPEMTWDVKGALSLDMDEAEIKDFKMDISGAASLDLNLSETELCEIDVKGAGSGYIDLSGSECAVRMWGASSMTLNVDCRTLNVVNRGAGTLRITGLADSVNLDGSGVTTIDVTGLNR